MQVSPDRFLVCGLGSLGQQCVAVLKEFGVTVCAIDRVEPSHWETADFPHLLDQLLIGDCCQPEVLQQAYITTYRAVLIVTSDERVNIKAAFAVRALNPTARLVIRSGQDNLNELLREQLGNLIAFEATQLPAKAFALAALGGEMRGFFSLENQMMQVVRVQLDPAHRWCHRRLLHELNSPVRRILSYTPAGEPPPVGFYQWHPNDRLQPGDTVVYVELMEPVATAASEPRPSWRQLLRPLTQASLQTQWQRIRQEIQQNQTQQVALLCGGLMFSLFCLGTVLFKLSYSNVHWQDALNVALVLAIGGFDNIFGQIELPFPVPWWLYLYSISLTVAGTVFVGILYAMLTERVLSARFQLLRRRAPVPLRDHVVLVGLGRVGQRVASLLQSVRQPVVGIHSSTLDASVLPQMPLIVGHLTTTLQRANLATAKSVMVVTDDEVANLEIGLRARATNPQANLVIRTFDPRFSENVARLLPYARILSAYALAAEAFVGAAFGERILELFRLSGQTILVTEYRVELGDTLSGLLLSEVAYGYGLVPLLYQRESFEPARLLPPDDLRLQPGDRLVVLATIEGLQQVEQGNTHPRQWQVRIEKAFTQEAIFEGSMAIARISGCDIGIARTVMRHLPETLPCQLYEHQAQRLVRALKKAQVTAEVVYSGFAERSAEVRSISPFSQEGAIE